MNDLTFNWTKDMNDFLRNNRDIKKRLIIYASTLMDAMFIAFFCLFFLYWKSYRIIFSLMVFFSIRGIVQVSPH
jgi:hypothetical protein